MKRSSAEQKRAGPQADGRGCRWSQFQRRGSRGLPRKGSASGGSPSLHPQHGSRRRWPGRPFWALMRPPERRSGLHLPGPVETGTEWGAFAVLLHTELSLVIIPFLLSTPWNSKLVLIFDIQLNYLRFSQCVLCWTSDPWFILSYSSVGKPL